MEESSPSYLLNLDIVGKNCDVIFVPQFLQDVDEEVAEMTKKKQRECEVG